MAVGLGMLSMAIALAIGLCKKTSTQYRLLAFLLGLLFFSTGLSGLFRAFGVDSNVQSVVNLLAGIAAILAGIVVWPLLKKTLTSPAYEQIEQTNFSLHLAVDNLHQQHRLFDAFMDHNPAIAFLEDAEGRFVYVNHSFETQVGVQREAVLGKPSTLWASPEEARQIRQHACEVLGKNQAISRIFYFPKSPDAQPEPWLVVRFPIPQNSVNAAIGAMGLNVSSEFEKQAVNSELATIVESTQDAIIGKDLDGNILSWNAGAEELYGYSAAEVLGKNMAILIPPEQVNELPEWLDKVRRGIRIQDHETVRMCKTGTVKDVAESVSPIRNGDGKIIGAAVIARDITVMKRQQTEIGKLNEQLKRQIYELAETNAALQMARDQALEASNLKSAFVANISHELRTPLSGIIGANAILLHNGRLKGEDLEMAQMVKQSADALLTIVNDILDLSKIEAGKITMECAPFNPAELVQDCSRLMAPVAQGKGLNYELFMPPEMPEMVCGNAARLRQVLLNIIGNAIKFTDRGTVQVRAQVLELSSEQAVLEFSVKDSGIGMSPADQRFLFMPFAQADNSSTRKFGGSGLGLTISKRFVDMMDGQILVQSASGSGSTFTLRVPFELKMANLAKESAPEKIVKPVIEPISAPDAAVHKILLVEDNVVLQYLALRQLQTLGIQAEATMLGRDAVDLAMSNRFDLVLMDINLPDMNGLEATEAIRKLEQINGRAEIPIIAMTAGAMKGDRERALAAGMSDYLSKPVAIEQLKSTLELWLRRSSIRGRSSESNLEKRFTGFHECA
jgi:PAS domain S-box-containing protein